MTRSCGQRRQVGSGLASTMIPMPKPSEHSREAATRLLHHFGSIGWPQQLPAGEEGLRQKDSVSCGLHCWHWAEAYLRELRGEGPSLADFEPKAKLHILRNWLTALATKSNKAKAASSKAATSSKAASSKTASS